MLAMAQTLVAMLVQGIGGAASIFTNGTAPPGAGLQRFAMVGNSTTGLVGDVCTSIQGILVVVQDAIPTLLGTLLPGLVNIGSAIP